MQLNGEIQCEHPNQNLLAFQGRISLAPTIPTKSKNNIIPLNIDNLLLRGAILKNTEFAWALVLFTGKHTKIMKNLKRAANKRSSLEISLNKFVFYAFLLNMALLASSVLLESQYYYYFRRQEEEGKDYLWYIGGVDDNVFLVKFPPRFKFIYFSCSISKLQYYHSLPYSPTSSQSPSL